MQALPERRRHCLHDSRNGGALTWRRANTAAERHNALRHCVRYRAEDEREREGKMPLVYSAAHDQGTPDDGAR